MSKPMLVAVVVLSLVTAFIIGFTIRTPADRCALDPDCSRAPVSGR
jgi:hypothetical protein